VRVQRKFRLTRSEDFKRVRRTGKSYAHPLVVLVVQACDMCAHVRVGVAAGKTTGTAVHRNRAKRLLREALRPYLNSLAAGMNMILIARPPLAKATLQDTRAALDILFKRAKILPSDES
jgi:ribonuclease P protein component